MTRSEKEAALDAGKLWVQMQDGAWWRLRRNGKTQTWKTRPADYRIPVKAGLRACGELTLTDSLTLYVGDVSPARTKASTA